MVNKNNDVFKEDSERSFDELCHEHLNEKEMTIYKKLRNIVSSCNGAISYSSANEDVFEIDESLDHNTEIEEQFRNICKRYNLPIPNEILSC